jgi:serine/threonine protein kinase
MTDTADRLNKALAGRYSIEREIDARTDIYSLGALLYEMLTGDPPHTGSTAQAIIARMLTERPRGVCLTRPTVPVHVEAAVERALEKLPAGAPVAVGGSEAVLVRIVKRAEVIADEAKEWRGVGAGAACRCPLAHTSPGRTSDAALRSAGAPSIEPRSRGAVTRMWRVVAFHCAERPRAPR